MPPSQSFGGYSASSSNPSSVASSPAQSPAQSPAPAWPAASVNNNLIPPNSAPSFFNNNRPNYASMITPNQLDFTSKVTPGSGPPSGPLGQYAVSNDDSNRLDEMFQECQRVNQVEVNDSEAARIRASVVERNQRMMERIFALRGGYQSVPMQAKAESTFNYNYNHVAAAPPSNANASSVAAPPPSSNAASNDAAASASRPGVAGPPDEDDPDL